MPFERELEAALEAARQASDLIRKDYDALVAIPNAPASISTATDRGSQEIILQYLQSVFPEDALCAEEATPTLAKARHAGPRTWIVDPIDGTRGFAMKNGEFSVMIGLVEQGKLAVGVVLEPVSGRVTYATRGGGCWLRTGDRGLKRCVVSKTADLNSSTLVQSHSRSPTDPSAAAKVMRPSRTIEVYSAGVKLAIVARGEADLYVNTYSNFSDWDICAGHLLVVEAGGKVTTLAGGEIQYCSANSAQQHGLLATNGSIHDSAVEALSHARIW